MSRLKQRRAIRAIDDHDSGDAALREQLEGRLDQLRATIEAKRTEGWTVVRSPAADVAPST